MAGELKRGDRFVIATHNAGKARELAELFASVVIASIMLFMVEFEKWITNWMQARRAAA